MDKNLSLQKNDGLSIVLCGQAGMGVQTVEFLLTRILKLTGYNVFATKEYMSRIRGGINSTEVRVSSEPIRAVLNRIDILVSFDKGAVTHLQKRISSGTLIFADKEALGDDIDKNGYNFIDVPFTQTAIEIGDKIFSNIVATGTIVSLFEIDLKTVTNFIKKFFSGKSEDIVQKNIEAAKAGYKLGGALVKSGKIKCDISRDEQVKDQILLSGTEAVALGAIAGGCNFISSYPMTPATGILVFLAQHAKDFGIIAEQAEDEIAAINMALGAWYAGARAMVSTSGGGFALMAEGVSLAGILETPIVINLGQRPGPATGLPTRTEQADLEFALYAGHGEFPRIILAPGKIEDAFYLTQKAFELADKYQIPVIILTDQYFADSYYNTVLPDLSDIKIKKHIVKTKKNYKRYELTENGISPRGIPGHGQGLVCLDSDEHDELGHITEDLDLRIKMVDKRLKKLELIKSESIPPEFIGPKDYKNLVVCWGSTYNILNEAVETLARKDLALLYFKQVHPLYKKTADYLKKAKRTIIFENNATGQFARQIKLHTGIDIDEKVLKYNGLSFTVEEVVEKLKSLLD